MTTALDTFETSGGRNHGRRFMLWHGNAAGQTWQLAPLHGSTLLARRACGLTNTGIPTPLKCDHLRGTRRVHCSVAQLNTNAGALHHHPEEQK